MKLATNLIALSAVSLLGISCKGTKTAQSDPYNTPQTYGGADPYATSGEYDNVYASGGGQAYGATNNTGGSYAGADPYQDNTPSYTPPAYTPPSNSYSGGGASAQGSGTHVVQRGDTLFNLSRRYGTSVSAIQRANGLNGDLIRIGERLVIP